MKSRPQAQAGADFRYADSERAGTIIDEVRDRGEQARGRALAPMMPDTRPRDDVVVHEQRSRLRDRKH